MQRIEMVDRFFNNSKDCGIKAKEEELTEHMQPHTILL